MRSCFATLAAASLLFISLFPAQGQSADFLSAERINFEVTVQSLHEQAQQIQIGPVEESDMFVLDGHTASVTIVPTDNGAFLAEIELVTGSWQGLQQVMLHRVIVQADEQFESRVSDRPVAQPESGTVVAGIELLVAGRLVEVRRDLTGRRVPVVRAERIRTRQ
ncbi:MAG: hypothetical protein ACLFNQ_01205 [Spirochaetaceae bacterium]